MFRRSIAVLFALGAAQFASAQPVPPEMAPATAPAPVKTVAADQTTPQGTLILLTRAMQSGNAQSAVPLLHSINANESALAGLLVQSIDVNLKFKNAVAKAYGDGVAEMFVGGAADADAAEKRISAAKVTIDGQAATIQPDENSEPVKLIQVDGIWKLSMAAIGSGEISQTVKELKLRLDVLSAISDDVNAGKFKSPQEMSDAIRGRMAAAALQAASAATSQPATAPTP